MMAATSRDALQRAALLPVALATVIDHILGAEHAQAAADQATDMAHRDPLTGLGNRRSWADALTREWARAHRRNAPFAILILDFDGLKTINDERGHAAGDGLLVRAANLLTSAGRASDVICRLGGDEFGIAAPDTDALQGQLLAARIRRQLADAGIALSVGWAVSSEVQNADELWQRADEAMYAQKRQAAALAGKRPRI